MKPVLKGILLVCLIVLLLPACAAPPVSADGKIITGNPRDFLLAQIEIPDGQNYFIPENEAFSIPNNMAIAAFGKEKGQALVDEEERVIAWRVHFQALRPNQPGAQHYLATVVQHQSASGAQTAVEKYNNAALYPEGGWEIVASDVQIGEKTVVLRGASQDEQGQPTMNHRIEFAYRNFSVDILIYGPQDQVSFELAKKAATAVLLKLKAAPLGTGPIPTPQP